MLYCIALKKRINGIYIVKLIIRFPKIVIENFKFSFKVSDYFKDVSNSIHIKLHLLQKNLLILLIIYELQLATYNTVPSPALNLIIFAAQVDELFYPLTSLLCYLSNLNIAYYFQNWTR